MPTAEEIERSLMRCLILLNLHLSLILHGSAYKGSVNTYVNSTLWLRATKRLHFTSRLDYQSIRHLKAEDTAIKTI
jgi:hypothetical protein